MPTVQAAVPLPGDAAEIERRWYDTERWPDWVDGLEEIIEVGGGWPEAGAIVHWRSVPAGRGEVTERVVEYEPGAGQVLAIEDGAMQARQTVAFTPLQDGLEVSLSLDYRISRRTPLTPLLELLFVSRALRASLASTLTRFAQSRPSGSS